MKIFKTLLVIGFVTSTCTCLQAQDVKLKQENEVIKNAKPDTTRLRVGSLKITMVEDNKGDTAYKDVFAKKKKKHRKSDGLDGHWAGFGLGFNNYVNSAGNTNTPIGYDYLELNQGKSINVVLNFYEKNINLYHQRLMLVTGLGVEWDNYRFRKNVQLLPNQSSIAAIIDTVNQYSKSKLVTDYINIPLLLNYSSKKSSFHISAGVIAGYMWSSHTKRKYESDDSKHKDYDDFNVNPFKASATARIGFGGFTLYGTYAMTTMFKDGQGPILYPFSMGIALDF